MTRIALFAALGVALALVAGTAPALAAPPVLPVSGPLVLSTVGNAEPGAETRPPVADAVRQQIFEILCGGLEPTDASLIAHLWQVAGSLARRDWTPPTVTVRSVVHSSAVPSR